MPTTGAPTKGRSRQSELDLGRCLLEFRPQNGNSPTMVRGAASLGSPTGTTHEPSTGSS